MLGHVLISGMTVGSIYALIGVGFTVVFATTRIINFAHGEMVMFGGVLYAFLIAAYGLGVIHAFTLTVLIAALGSWLIYVLAVSSIDSDNHIAQVMVTLGVGVALKGAVEVFIGKDTFFPSSLSSTLALDLAGVMVSSQAIWILFTLIAFLTGFYFLLHFTRFGRGMRATAINGYAATLVGVSTRKAAAASFVIAGSIGALAGALMAPLTSMHYDNGMFLAIKGFAAAILGGIGNPAGALAGGMIIGLTESLAAGYISSVYKDSVALGLLLAVLLVKPQGLFSNALPQKL